MEETSTETLRILGIGKWTFGITPDQDIILPWGDRHDLLIMISRLIRRLSGYNASTLHLLWADFGAGKSHTLLYLRQLAINESKGRIFPIYAVLPRESKSFIDIYRAIIKGLGISNLVNVYSQLQADQIKKHEINSSLNNTIPMLSNVFKTLSIGNEQAKASAQKWILADPGLSKHEQDQISLPSKLKTTDDALAVLTVIFKMVHEYRYPRVMVMIDEFQRAGKARGGVLDNINNALHTLINNFPHGLTLILSFSFGSEANVKFYLNSELISRADPQTITISALDVENGKLLLNDLLYAATSPEFECKIDISAITATVDYLNSRATITPRRLTKLFGLVLSDGALDLEDRIIDVIDGNYVIKLLEEKVNLLDGLVDEEED